MPAPANSGKAAEPRHSLSFPDWEPSFQAVSSGYGFLAAVIKGVVSRAGDLAEALDASHRHGGNPGYPAQAMMSACVIQFALNERYASYGLPLYTATRPADISDAAVMSRELDDRLALYRTMSPRYFLGDKGIRQSE